MKIQRFFLTNQPLDKTRGELISITDPKLIRQWRNVFRMKAGDEIILLDNSGYEYPAKFLPAQGWSASGRGKNKAEFEILNKIKNEVIPKREVVLYQSLIKKDKFEWVVQKATELGVSEFVPVLSERSEKKDLNMERLAVIAREATEQSGRGKLPKFNELLKLPEALESIKNDSVVFDASGIHFDSTRSTLYVPRLTIFIGPEGGWSPGELDLFKSKNIPVVSLGNMTLRAETAAVAVSSLLFL